MNNRLFDLLRRANHKVAALYMERHPVGLTLPQFSLLSALEIHGTQTIPQLIAATEIERGTIHPMIDRLERADFVTRTRAVKTGRRGRHPVGVKITPDGRREWKVANAALGRAEIAVIGKLSGTEQVSVFNTLKKIAFV